MATEEVLATVVEDPATNTAPANPAAGVAVGKEGNLKKSNPKKPRKRDPSYHPSYIEMIREVITSLKEKLGSSQYAITKFIEEKHKERIPPNFRKLLLIHLRKLTANGKLSKVKNSYKISAVDAKKKPAVAAQSKSKAVKKAATIKPKPRQTGKPKVKAVLKLKPTASGKTKTAVKRKLKPAAAKLTARPAKAAKTSSGKKAAPAAVKRAAVKSAKKVRSVKPAGKSPPKKTLVGLLLNHAIFWRIMFVQLMFI